MHAIYLMSQYAYGLSTQNYELLADLTNEDFQNCSFDGFPNQFTGKIASVEYGKMLEPVLKSTHGLIVMDEVTAIEKELSNGFEIGTSIMYCSIDGKFDAIKAKVGSILVSSDGQIVGRAASWLDDEQAKGFFRNSLPTGFSLDKECLAPESKNLILQYLQAKQKAENQVVPAEIVNSCKATLENVLNEHVDIFREIFKFENKLVM